MNLDMKSSLYLAADVRQTKPWNQSCLAPIGEYFFYKMEHRLTKPRLRQHGAQEVFPILL